VLNANGSFTYTPSANYNGADSFTYHANDGQADSNVATVSINIAAVNDAPVAQDDSVLTAEDTSVSGNVLTNDTDVDGDTLHAVLDTGPAHGTLTFNPDGSFTYTPASNYNNPDSFTYHANDGQADSNVATVNINITPVNDAPAAADNSVSGNEDTPISGTLSASDVDGPTITYSIFSQPSHGTITSFNSSTGEFTYQGNLNYNGADSFTFNATDGTRTSNTATESITINPVNDAPVANDDSFTTAEDTSLTANVLDNDSDVEGDTLTATLVTGPAHGTLTFNADGSFTYMPAANYNGADSFTYKANDGQADSNVATVSLMMSTVNDGPTANNDNAGSTAEDTDKIITCGSLLANDSAGPANESGQSIHVFSVTATADTHGTVTLYDNGTPNNFSDDYIVYHPNAGYVGSASFNYTIQDNGTTNGQPDYKTASATVFVTVENRYIGNSTIVSNFNGTAIAGGDYVWFNSIVKVNGRNGREVTLRFDRSTISFTANSVNYVVNVPVNTIIFSAAVTQASTTYDSATDSWTTLVPVGYTGNVFLSGVAFQVPAAGLPGGIGNIAWTGRFSSPSSGLSVDWKWAAAVYDVFSSDESALGVKAIDGNQFNIFANSDHAGTPEFFEDDVIGGARGGGGSNYTGSYSGTGHTDLL
jgi:VCBS repeat-containing protein